MDVRVSTCAGVCISTCIDVHRSMFTDFSTERTDVHGITCTDDSTVSTVVNGSTCTYNEYEIHVPKQALINTGDEH